jgi:hypothetical protein
MMITLAGVIREFEFRWREWNIFAQEKEGIVILAYAKHFAAFDCKGGLGSLLFCLEADIESTEPEDINIQHNFLHLDLRS